MPVKLLNCALPIIKGLYDILFVCCSHGFYLLCCRSYCGTLVQLYSSSIAAVFTFTIPKTLFGSTAQDLSLSWPLGNFINLCVCFIFFFFSGRNSTRKWPGWSQCSDQLRAEQLRPRGIRRLGGLPEPGCSNRGLGRYLSCGFILHKVVFHLSGICNCSWVLKSL